MKRSKKLIRHLRSVGLAGFFVLMHGAPSRAIQVFPRILSPNGDGWNDKVLFQVENDAFLPLSGEIFDTRGAKVSDLVPESDPFTVLSWDGRRGGSRAPGGIYIYQILVGDKQIRGTVVVAE